MKLLKTVFAFTLLSVTWQVNAQNWKSYYEDSQILIEIGQIDHDSPSDGIKHERLVFKYTNKTDQEITLSFQRKLAYNGQQLAEARDRSYSLLIEPKSSRSYEENNRDKAFYIFYRDLKGTIKKVLSNYELSNIKTE